MPTVLTHALVGAGLTGLCVRHRPPRRLWLCALLLPVLPDLDVIGMAFGIPYSAPWGHRGLTHSLCAALVVGFVVTYACMRGNASAYRTPWVALGLSLVTASHSLLDACTNGGRGVALLGPIDHGRYFLPWRFIQVSPLGIERFFSARGLAVLASEALWLWLPLLAVLILRLVYRRLKRA